MTHRGFLVIADISGYTRFLTGSELDHAQGVLEDLFAVILDRLKAPLTLSNIQGDAFFAFANDDFTWSPGQILDCIEALYFGFHDRLTEIVDNTTCTCRACSNAKKLDLKFVVHHGEYASQTIAGREELTGPDVILLHRLLKNDVAEKTDIASYALFTSAALEALDLDELRQGVHAYATDLDEFGRVEGAVVDFAERWKSHHAQNEIVVGDDELWMAPVSKVLPHDADTVWTVYWHPDHRTRWNANLQKVLRAKGDPGRLRVGAVDHCAHGKQTVLLRYIDVRPLKHVTSEIVLPGGGKCLRTTSLSREGSATRLTIKQAWPEGPNPVATFLLRLLGGLFHKKRIRAEAASELVMLEQYIAENVQPGSAPGDAQMSLSQGEITRAARELAAS